MSFLEVKNLHKSFGSTQVLKGIDFALQKGDVVSIIGSSGSGKTTLLRCLNFLELADTGSVFVKGEEIFNAQKKYADRELRKNRLHFGLVFQGFNLFPQYTALTNVRLPLDMQTKERLARARKAMSKTSADSVAGAPAKTSLSARFKAWIDGKKSFAEKKKQALEENAVKAERILCDVGLGEKMNNYPCELSGGQCQRVAIARALALEPEILCFDEPTSALDPELTGEVLRVIRSLKSPDRAMVIVTHEMQFAAEISDKVIFMADGVIEEAGTPQQIFRAPQSEKLKAFLRNYAENR